MKTIDKILHFLKREGQATAKQLSAELSMTTMGVRQHLQSLESEGLISFYDQRIKVGRPTRHWKLTQQGHQHFSDGHSELSIQLLDAVQQTLGSTSLQTVLQAREENSYQKYKTALINSTSITDKVQTLAKLREQEGYMAEMIESAPGQYLLIENHCPICKAAQNNTALCQSELTIFQRLLGTTCTVDRIEHIIQGQRRCAYRITVNN
ncbi:helix-turn-helix transcriptional regulator [Thaumasiovibrio sp. DFM-14]|uniref:helix-turn-helix transcriptional regulator n=1 Tax=Thaumasiovibrio sp. DFM-14 TaxID=3384792 RepID=UPI0039A271DB